MTNHERRIQARKIVKKVLDDLLDRRGFRQIWDGCSQQIKEEIRKDLIDIVARELKNKPE